MSVGCGISQGHRTGVSVGQLPVIEGQGLCDGLHGCSPSPLGKPLHVDEHPQGQHAQVGLDRAIGGGVALGRLFGGQDGLEYVRVSPDGVLGGGVPLGDGVQALHQAQPGMAGESGSLLSPLDPLPSKVLQQDLCHFLPVADLQRRRVGLAQVPHQAHRLHEDLGD